MRDPEFLHGSFHAHATMMSVCADELTKAVNMTAGLGMTVDDEMLSEGLAEQVQILRPLLGKLQRLMDKIEDRRARSLQLAEINGGLGYEVDSSESVAEDGVFVDHFAVQDAFPGQPVGAPPAAEGPGSKYGCPASPPLSSPRSRGDPSVDRAREAPREARVPRVGRRTRRLRSRRRRWWWRRRRGVTTSRRRSC